MNTVNTGIVYKVVKTTCASIQLVKPVERQMAQHAPEGISHTTISDTYFHHFILLCFCFCFVLFSFCV